jgi:hypothetical protein
MRPSFLRGTPLAKGPAASITGRWEDAPSCGWLPAVILAGVLGFSPASYGNAQQQFTLDTPVVVTVDALRVRDAPGLSARIVATLLQGSKGVIVDASPHWADGYWWWHIAYRNGIRGWSADGDAELVYLRIDPDPAAPQQTQPPPGTPTAPTTTERSSLTIVVVPSLMGVFSLSRHDLVVVMEGPETVQQVIPSVPSAFPVTVTFEGLAPGTYRVTAQHGGSRLSKDVSVRGRTLEVDFVMP